MRNQVLVRRYAEGLAGALKSVEEYDAVRRELVEFSDLLETNANLREALLRPFLPAEKKTRIVQDVLDRQSCLEKTRRFVNLLLRHRRMEILSPVLRDLPSLWNEHQGVVSFEIRSVVPVEDGQRIKLEAELRKLEGRPVSCTYVLDPGIVGGLYIKKGNMIYDVSLKGQLERLKEIIRER